MDKQAVAERIARERWEEIVERLNLAHMPSWDKIGENERIGKTAHIEEILEASGYFKIADKLDHIKTEIQHLLIETETNPLFDSKERLYMLSAYRNVLRIVKAGGVE